MLAAALVCCAALVLAQDQVCIAGCASLSVRVVWVGMRLRVFLPSPALVRAASREGTQPLHIPPPPPLTLPTSTPAAPCPLPPFVRLFSCSQEEVRVTTFSFDDMIAGELVPGDEQGASHMCERFCIVRALLSLPPPSPHAPV